MSVIWIESLKFAIKTWDWVGLAEFQGSKVEVLCKCFDDKGARDGAAPPTRLVRRVEHLVLEALYNHDRDISSIASSLADLYNQQWRPARSRKVSSGDLRDELKLKRIRLAQGVTRDQYQVVLADPRLRFRSYIPQAEIDNGKVTSIGVFPPYDPDGQAQLPFLGAMHHAELPAHETTQRMCRNVGLTKKTKKFKWVDPLSFNTGESQWIGTIEFQRKRLVIRVASSKRNRPESWADPLLSRILASLAPAKEEAACQLTDHYNDSWIEDREMSVAAVKRRIQLDSIEVDRKEDWALWFTDGDLFGGHWIRVDVDVSGEVTFELYG